MPMNWMQLKPLITKKHRQITQYYCGVIVNQNKWPTLTFSLLLATSSA